MGLRELGYRAAQSVHTRWQRAGLGRAKPVPADAARGRPWIPAWPENLGVNAYREAADGILSGKFRLFGDREWTLGFPPSWNRDPATGTIAPLGFGIC